MLIKNLFLSLILIIYSLSLDASDLEIHSKTRPHVLNPLPPFLEKLKEMQKSFTCKINVGGNKSSQNEARKLLERQASIVIFRKYMDEEGNYAQGEYGANHHPTKQDLPAIEACIRFAEQLAVFGFHESFEHGNADNFLNTLLNITKGERENNTQGRQQLLIQDDFAIKQRYVLLQVSLVYFEELLKKAETSQIKTSHNVVNSLKIQLKDLLGNEENNSQKNVWHDTDLVSTQIASFIRGESTLNNFDITPKIDWCYSSESRPKTRIPAPKIAAMSSRKVTQPNITAPSSSRATTPRGPQVPKTNGNTPFLHGLTGATTSQVTPRKKTLQSNDLKTPQTTKQSILINNKPAAKRVSVQKTSQTQTPIRSTFTPKKAEFTGTIELLDTKKTAGSSKQTKIQKILSEVAAISKNSEFPARRKAAKKQALEKHAEITQILRANRDLNDFDREQLTGSLESLDDILDLLKNVAVD